MKDVRDVLERIDDEIAWQSQGGVIKADDALDLLKAARDEIRALRSRTVTFERAQEMLRSNPACLVLHDVLLSPSLADVRTKMRVAGYDTYLLPNDDGAPFYVSEQTALDPGLGARLNVMFKRAS